MIRPSATFKEVLKKTSQNANSLYRIPSPDTNYESSTGYLHLCDNQDKFFAHLEIWLDENKDFIRQYVSHKWMEEIQPKDNIIQFK